MSIVYTRKSCCGNCGKYYYGEFKKRNDGKYYCIDCDNPVYLGTEDIVQTSLTDKDYKRFLGKIYFNYLEEDIHLFYTFLGENLEEFIDLFIDNEVLKHDKLFYQWNDYAFVEYMRTVALEFREYLAKDFYKELSLKWIVRYLSLRNEKIDQEIMDNWYIESELELLYLDDLDIS